MKNDRLRRQAWSAMSANKAGELDALLQQLDEPTGWLVLADAATLGHLGAVSILFPRASRSEQLQSALRAVATRRHECVVWMCQNASAPDELAPTVLENAVSRSDATLVASLLDTVQCDTTLALAAAAQVGSDELIARLLPRADPMGAACQLLITLDASADRLATHLNSNLFDPTRPAHQMARDVCAERADAFPRLHAFFRAIEQAQALENQTAPAPPRAKGKRL